MQATVERVRQNREKAYEAYRTAECARIYQDETTWLAESLEAPLEKEREYTLTNGDLYSDEGVNLRDVFYNSIGYYEDLARQNPRYTFQHDRSLLEFEEYGIMRDMADGKGANTLIVCSTYPRGLMDATKDELGYKYKRQLGFIRVIKRVSPGKVKMWTHTFDRNDAQGIEAMYGRLGRSVDWSRDVLGQRIQVDLGPEQQELIGDELLYAYDAALNAKDGGKYYAGRSEADRRDGIEFVESQADLIAKHIDKMFEHGQKPGQKSEIRYNTAVALRRRHEGRQFEADSVDAEMSGAGAAGRSSGEDVSGCGLTIEGVSSTSQGLSEAGYKVVDLKHEPLGRQFDACMNCPKCKNTGVWVQVWMFKGQRRKDYTCSNSGCGATTLPKEPPVAKVENSAITRTSSSVGNTSKGEYIAARYGEYARVRTEVGFGAATEVVYDSRSGETITKL